MLNIFTVAFFGHRYVDDLIRVEKLLEEQIEKLLKENEYIDFLVGRSGDFDQCAASTVRRMRRKYGDDNSSLILILPYSTAEYLDKENDWKEYYTDIEISDAAARAYPKSAFQIRNREMVDRADLIICYIKNIKGGAWQTIKYAMMQGKQIINLAQ